MGAAAEAVLVMPGIDLDRLERVAELLGLAFYGLMLVAVAAALSGAPGWGFVMLVLGAGAHVGRASFEEFVERQRARVERSAAERPSRPVSTRPRRSSRPDDEFVVTATRQRRAVKLGG
jgi:hypothetical protein